MTEPRRVLLVDDDSLVLGVGGDLLHAGGYAVQLLAYPTLAVPTAQKFKPDVIVLDVNMPVLNGREVMKSLASFEETKNVPVVVLSAVLSPRDQVRFLGLGAVDLWAKPFDPSHVDRLDQHFSESVGSTEVLSPLERARKALLAFHRREQSQGALVVNPGTPFEGRAIFVKGALTHARLGPLSGEQVLDEMLTIDQGIWRWEAGAIEPPPEAPPAVAFTGYKPRVLLVDDDPALRKLYALQLQRVGFEVSSAEDGEAGQRLATEGSFDVLVADLNMPVLDGWGMLKLIKSSPRTRETPVLVLSAHDDYRETLKAARAGAHDYLRKTGHGDELIRRVRALVAPRAQLAEAIREGKPTPRIELSVVGPQWLLRTLAELDASCALDATDDWGEYHFKLDRGHLASATATAGTRTLSGMHAIGALLVSRGAQGSLAALPAGSGEDHRPWLAAVVEDACRHVTVLEQRIGEERLKKATRLTVEPELAALFERIGSDADLKILRAIMDPKIEPRGLAEHLGVPQDAVDAGLKELVRRGVVRL